MVISYSLSHSIIISDFCFKDYLLLKGIKSDQFSNTDRIKFYGDRVDPAGNDYPLAVLLEPHQVFAVKDWKHTRKLLKNE